MIKLEIGKTYMNGWGSERKIVGKRGYWFMDQDDMGYHEDGAVCAIGNMGDTGRRGDLIDTTPKDDGGGR